MALIQTLDEAVEQRIRECHLAIGDRYHRSVRPVFASVKGTEPKFVGSCTLISLGDRKFGVTAAHVTDWLQGHALHIGGSVGTQPVQMQGTVHYTQAPQGRLKDKVDIAFWSFTDKAAQGLGDVVFVKPDHFCHNKVSTEGRLFMALGYPLSRNKKSIDSENSGVAPTAWRYTGPVEEVSDVSETAGLSSERHLLLKFEKYSATLDGGKVSSINPQGISGGALLDLGAFFDISNYAHGKECQGLLAGIIIEKSKWLKALVAVKLGIIVQAIKARHGL
jgi:hypothetical protein